MEFENIKNFDKILEAFPFKGELSEIHKTEKGLINGTYIMDFSDGNRNYNYVLQEINTNVFRNVDELMSNIMSITGFLRNKIVLEGGNPERETLTFLYTKDNSPYFKDSEGHIWRSYIFVDNCYTCEKIDEPAKALRSGKAFGHFQKLLSDYPIDGLFETIPDFHNTPVRYDALTKAIDDNISGRLCNVKDEIEFAMSRRHDASRLTDMIKTGELPIRVTHNDTKINNLLFDSITNEALCVIDLDTTMPGLSLYDFGDSIRSGAVTSDENERDLSKYSLDLELYKSFTEGFLMEAGKALTEKEIEYLPFSAKLLALECGVRFLTDYLNGDTYFKTQYPEHNLIKCHTQFKLVEEIENHFDELVNITNNAYRSALLED